LAGREGRALPQTDEDQTRATYVRRQLSAETT
jgi:hypothetical protein